MNSMLLGTNGSGKFQERAFSKEDDSRHALRLCKVYQTSLHESNCCEDVHVVARSMLDKLRNVKTDML